jgi:uncharacterized protein YoxC
MNQKKSFLIIVFVILATTLACSLSGIGQKAQEAQQTAQALGTQVEGLATEGGSLIDTVQAVATEHPGILETVKAIATQGAPILETIQAVATNNPGLIQTAKAIVTQGLGTGEPPSDIPIFNRDQAQNFFGTGQYITYFSTSDYPQILNFYKTEMPNNGWQYLQGASNEYANAAILHYSKDNRTAIVNLSLNPLNNTTVIMITIITQ